MVDEVPESGNLDFVEHGNGLIWMDFVVFLAIMGVFYVAVYVQANFVLNVGMNSGILVIPMFFAMIFSSLSVVVRRSSRVIRQKQNNLSLAKEKIALLNSSLRNRLNEQGVRLEEVQSQLEWAQNGTNVAALAAGVVHDINNAMMVASHAIEELSAGDTADPEEEIRDAKQAVEMVMSLTMGFRDALLQNRSETTTDVAHCVQSLEPLLKRTLEVHHDLRVTYDSSFSIRPPPRVAFELFQLNQVLMNLVINARDAMRGRRGMIEVHLGLEDSGMVQIQVRDEGEGMTPEVKSKIFEPFFSTKPSHKGSGLGLHILHNLVSKAGGSVSVDSEAGEGAVFTLRIPNTGVGDSETVDF